MPSGSLRSSRLKVPRKVKSIPGLPTTSSDGHLNLCLQPGVKRLNQIAEESAEGIRKCQTMLQNMPVDVRQVMNCVALASGAQADTDFSLPSYQAFSVDWVDDKDFYPVISHEGGEYINSIYHAYKSLQNPLTGAKYPLAIVDHILDNYGSDVGIRYDIGCAHEATLVVNAFHGYGHNRLCQLSKHPLYLTGYGLEDLETLERVFSASNSVARGIRHATRYHWLQSIDLHFQQWDDDQYQNISKFLYNNYQQALTIIKDCTPHVSAMITKLGIRKDSIKDWIKAEHNLLANLKDEPEERVLGSAYVRAFIQRNKVDIKWQTVSESFRAVAIDTMQELVVAIRAVGNIEEKMGIVNPWTTETPEYQQTLQYMHQQDVYRALDKLQQLVIQHLFELSKANIAGTGYKL
ncbi:hypothetical protein SERLA73DRAFT_68093 [Serpula lacrymans var. lacrymans S7.3]|uniref:Uncharacterized protein n=2 Tax=Serpula lacrymans var. lacrymans TaxID=341189 RepID=F8PGX3_SERL3|nr:uncharacterized protein SERLADRAFT_431820 [Serpula lacrymans var. lacrymans S7.9]EGO04410.1 hypothetical protein SERLA73DRAFT_68093 [Serpula lacrymans var. lacrymans S7.3]EGO30312.1 hypothetical protein SERLADRAFT_431820 [Serpula lacrymans var. lacrymans S7.9]